MPPVRKSPPLLPLHLVNHLASEYAIHWTPAGVCKHVDETRRARRCRQATRIQAAYRGRRARYAAEEGRNGARMSHGDTVRMYLVHYPFEYLQRWPDLALRKCPDLTPAQRRHLEALPSTLERTRRDVRGVMCALTVGQIQYVGW